jgi:hypothetical protein
MLILIKLYEKSIFLKLKKISFILFSYFVHSKLSKKGFFAKINPKI